MHRKSKIGVGGDELEDNTRKACRNNSKAKCLRVNIANAGIRLFKMLRDSMLILTTKNGNKLKIKLSMNIRKRHSPIQYTFSHTKHSFPETCIKK